MTEDSQQQHRMVFNYKPRILAPVQWGEELLRFPIENGEASGLLIRHFFFSSLVPSYRM